MLSSTCKLVQLSPSVKLEKRCSPSREKHCNTIPQRCPQGNAPSILRLQGLGSAPLRENMAFPIAPEILSVICILLRGDACAFFVHGLLALR